MMVSDTACAWGYVQEVELTDVFMGLDGHGRFWDTRGHALCVCFRLRAAILLFVFLS